MKQPALCCCLSQMVLIPNCYQIETRRIMRPGRTNNTSLGTALWPSFLSFRKTSNCLIVSCRWPSQVIDTSYSLIPGLGGGFDGSALPAPPYLHTWLVCAFAEITLPFQTESNDWIKPKHCLRVACDSLVCFLILFVKVKDIMIFFGGRS